MKELLFSLSKKDFKMQTFRSGGKGGQNQNKNDSGVRIIHSASGAVGESREHKSQLANKKAAFQRMTETLKFRLWMNRVVYEITSGETIEEKVDKQMNSKNLKIEIVDEDGRWV